MNTNRSIYIPQWHLQPSASELKETYPSLGLVRLTFIHLKWVVLI